MSNIVKGSGLLYTTGVPNTIPSTAHDSEFAIDINGNQYAWNRTTSVWDNLGQGIEIATSSIAPTHVPSKFRPRFVITPTRELYFYSGSWGLVNPTSGGGDGNGIYSGSGTVPDGTIATFVGDFSFQGDNEIPVFKITTTKTTISEYTDTVKIVLQDSDITVTDAGNALGLQYADDYSTTIKTNDRSIPDVGTVKQIARPYKVYTALLTQSGTDDPVATVLENTLSGTPVWTRVDTGQYYCTLVNEFTSGKTVMHVTPQIYSESSTDIYTLQPTPQTSDIFLLETTYTYSLSDGILGSSNQHCIEIRVYP